MPTFRLARIKRHLITKMPSIQRFFDQSVVVRRLKTSSGYKKTFQGTATVEGHIQELDQRARQLMGILEEKAWEAWFDPDIDIREGDRITGDDGKIYTVREVVKKDYGVNQHLQVILQEQND